MICSTFTTLINGYQEKLQKLFEGEKKTPDIIMRMEHKNENDWPDSKFSRVSEELNATGLHSYYNLSGSARAKHDFRKYFKY